MKKIIPVKATTKPRSVSACSEQVKKCINYSFMYIDTEYVSVIANMHSIDQMYQFETATENAERRLYELYGMSNIEICSDAASMIHPERCILMQIPLKHLSVLLEEYAKKYYHFEYDVIPNYGTLVENDKQYSKIAKINRNEVGEEAFKAIAKMYIGDNVDISDIGYIQIQAPIVEYGK